MAPVTREMAEAGSSTQQSAFQQSNPQSKSAPAHSRSDAVSLEIPIKVHGSRVTGSAGGTQQTEPFGEETTTMIVFPQGAVVRMAAGVNAGQMLVLTNLKSRQDAICRVLKVRSFPNMQSYVEVEFTHAQVGYWGVYFPSEGAAVSREHSAPASRTDTKPKSAPQDLRQPVPGHNAATVKPAETAVYSKDVKPVRPTAPAAPPAIQPASPFVSLGAQEQIQPAAAATSDAKATSSLWNERQSYATEQPREETALSLSETQSAKPELDAQSLVLQDLTRDVETLAASLAHSKAKEGRLGAEATDNLRHVLGTLENALAQASDGEPVPAEAGAYGVRLEAQIGRSSSVSLEPRQNSMLIAACAAVLFATVAGGVWYFRSPSGPPKAEVASQTAPAAEPTASSAAPRPASTELAVGSGSTTAPATDLDGTSHATPASKTSAMTGSHAAAAKTEDAAPVQSNEAVDASPPASTATQSLFAPRNLKAHPLTSQRSMDSKNQAPVLDGTPGSAPQPGELPGIGSAAVTVPPPPGAAPDPLRIGGAVKEPKLISSTMPVYPPVARQTHIQGDVVIDTQIDKDGKVVHMKALSGPMTLRQAALDALARWRYEPSQLDGQPVEVEMIVTIKFRL
jgi:TonB family protein